MVWTLMVLLGMATGRGDLEEKGELELSGSLHASLDQSAVELWRDRLLVVGDEGGLLQVLRRVDSRHYAVDGAVRFGVSDDEEFDLEALAVHGDVCWALGSHSLSRPRMDPARTLAENQRRLREIVRQPRRDCLYRLELRDDGTAAGPPTRIDLRPRLEQDPILAPFTRIPGKENGVDFEGLAWFEGRLFLGLRSPVLRGDFAVVMVLDPSRPEDHELRFIELRGFGIRGLASTRGGLLGIAGPVNGMDEDHRMFFWDGRDGLPGKDATAPRFRWYGKIPGPKKGKAEGLTVLEERDDEARVLVLYDGVKDGRPTIVDVPR